MEKLNQNIDQLLKANVEYTKGTPIMEDYEYDALFKETVELGKNIGIDVLTILGVNHSPEDLEKSNDKVRHSYKMGSLANSYNLDDAVDFVLSINNRCLDPTSEKEFILEPKLDGCSLSLIYDEGVLQDVITRGDGTVGESIIDKAPLIKGIPSNIEIIDPIIIRGELLKDREDFEKNYSSEYKNPRNFVAGALRLLDLEQFKSYNLSFVPYYITKNNGKNVFDTQSKTLETLEKLGFERQNRTVMKFNKNSVDKFKSVLEDYYTFMDDAASDSKYALDGLVIKLNDLNEAYKMNEDNSTFYPRNAFALKFKNMLLYSKLIDVEWQIGRTGKFTPVGIIEPVKSRDNCTINRVTLNNMNFIKSLDLKINKYITLVKSGEIIPKVVGTFDNVEVDEKQFKDIHELGCCPYCGSKIITKENGIPECSVEHGYCLGILMKSLEYVASRDVLDIQGISEAFCTKFAEALVHISSKSKIPVIYLRNYPGVFLSGLIEDILIQDNKKKFVLDDYRLLTDFKNSFGDKTLNNIYHALEEARYKLTPIKFLTSLCIPNIARNTLNTLLEMFDGDIDELLNVSNYAVNNTTEKMNITIKTPSGIKYLNNKYIENNLIPYLKDIEDFISMIKMIDKVDIESNNIKVPDKPIEYLLLSNDELANELRAKSKDIYKGDTGKLKIAVTGKISINGNPVSRTELEKVFDNKIRVVDFSTNIDYLLVQTTAYLPQSSKVLRAQRSGVKIIGVEDLIKLLNK